MSEDRSGEEVRARNIAAMGQELGELYTLLSAELIWLFVRWKQYVQLFADKPSRIEIINESAPFFFGLIQRVLWEETLLGIARLAGPVATAGKQNLSMHRIPPLLSNHDLESRVSVLLDIVDEQGAFAIDWRNRHIAHRDLNLLLNSEAEPLAIASKELVDSVLDSMAALLNAIDQHYFRSTTAYRMALTTFGAEELLYTLRDGLRLRKLRDERLEEGHYDSREWNDDAPAV